MKRIWASLCLSGVFLCLASVAPAADQTWTGQISDSMCGAKHPAGEHGATLTPHDCTIACVKGGAKYVFISGGKTYQIANQNDPDLQVHAGHTVNLTGALAGEIITVSKVVMPAKKSS